VAFETRKPYPIIQTFEVDSWDAAQAKARELRDEFETMLREDEAQP
jgi:hypothetical protein